MSGNKQSGFSDEFVDVVYELDSEGFIQYVNRAFLNLLRGSHEEIVGRKFSCLCLAHRKIQVEALVADCIEGEGAGRRFDVQLVRPDGSIVHLDCSLSPVETESGRVLRGMARELTESKKLQRELLSARDHAVSAMRLKGEFVANMSHEMRTPMNGIIGMTDLALETEVTDEQREYLLAVKSSANAMLTLINDILDFSKLEAGRLTLEEIEFGLADSVAESLTPLAVRAHQKGLELVYEFDPDIADSVIGDPSRLRQIIINLVDNAIKFTDSGQVHLAVRLEERSGQEATVRFDVTDTGIGIDESQHRVIFRSFCQADGTSTRKYGGTGLGLTISTQLVEMMGGRISVRSKPGVGSTFSFTTKFIFSDQPTTKHRLLRSQELRNVRVLVADDNSINRRTISTTLGSLGMDVVTCCDGAEAWAEFHAAADENHPFAVALLDVQMPG
ncbi:MAG: PAS domain-containing protein, partial [Actinomycetia bacterium]|nr:PAS domain-containing protein [Actinomycetes bacterium]